MPSFTIKVPNHDEGEDLGEYESDYLPRVGDRFTLWHRRLSPDKGKPFCGVVEAVMHEATDAKHPYWRGGTGEPRRSSVVTTVWLVEEMGAPTLYCDCSEEQRTKHGVDAGCCKNCGQLRSR
jgi:hypothetical protein